MHTLLGGLFRTALVLAGSSAALAGQLEVRASTSLAELVRHTRTVLADQAPANGHDLARFVFANLRMGDVAGARSLLHAYHGDQDPFLVLCAHATFLRATGELVLGAEQQRRLERSLTRAEQEPAHAFCSASLLVHGRYCLGQICAGKARLAHERLATTRLLALESETWQPGRGHYRPTPCNGKLRVPEAADASLLVPHSFGMLIASGNRLTRHLSNTLKASRSRLKHRWRAAVLPKEAPALRLLAAAQLGDGAQTASAYNEVVRQRASDASLAALNLEAVLQAVTGVRIAAGAGHSEPWLQMKPWLPADCIELELHGLRAQQHQFGIYLRRDRTKDVTVVEVQLMEDKDTSLSLVVANPWQQYVTTVSGDQPFRCELPTRQPLPTDSKTNDDALHRFGFRAR